MSAHLIEDTILLAQAVAGSGRSRMELTRLKNCGVGADRNRQDKITLLLSMINGQAAYLTAFHSFLAEKLTMAKKTARLIATTAARRPGDR